MFPERILERMASAKVVAGFALNHAEHAVPVARALLTGGIEVIELTLRTPAAMDSIRAISKEVPKMLLGVGTILTPDQLLEVKASGAHFGVSPGMNPRVIQAAKDANFPFAPGIATPSDVEAAIELGCRFVKFFPAEAAGGIKFLRSMSAPYQHLGIEYFPLGGLNTGNMMDYLAESNVPCIGGSWIVKNDMVENEDWAGISACAEEVVNILKG
ncbi:MAG: bifunctional 4-hydroxy-2-oxoglutarate aldolase/2-dehydro-3-deoxy-phosphogluconate aldolase [Opitutaceae bacterium]